MTLRNLSTILAIVFAGCAGCDNETRTREAISQPRLSEEELAERQRLIDEKTERHRLILAEVAAEREKEKRRQNAGSELVRCEGRCSTQGNVISPNRKIVACIIRDDDSVSLWSTETGKLLRTLSPPTGVTVNHLFELSPTFSRDSQYFACIARQDLDSRVILWNIQTGEPLAFASGKRDQFDVLGVTNTFVVAAADGDAFPIHVWKLSGGSPTTPSHSFDGHRKKVNCLAVSPDGAFAASGGEERVVILWEIATGREIKLFDAHESEVLAVAFSPNGKQLLTGGFEGSVRLWDIETGNVLHSWQLALFNALAEAEWRSQLASDNIAFIASGYTRVPPLRIWPYPQLRSLDISPTGMRALVGFKFLDPRLLKNSSNPIILDLVTHEVIELPAGFAPHYDSWSAFLNDDAGVFVRKETERVRGEDVELQYYSVLTLP